jgi:IMP dehydrogenase
MTESWPMALTFDDVLLSPAASSVLPRAVSLSVLLTRDTSTCSGIQLQRPLISAAMDTVTEAPMAIAQAQAGGLGIIHKNLTIARQVQAVEHVKKYESGVVKAPVTITPDASITEALLMTQQYQFSSLPVVKDGTLLGLLTNRDMRFVEDLTQPVESVMTPMERLVTVKSGTAVEVAASLMHTHRIEKVLIISDSGALEGMITARDILNAQAQPHATKDAQGRLRVGAAVGVGADSHARVAALVDAGCDVLVVDTAHGHSSGVIDQVKWIKSKYPHIPLIAGNIATGQAAKDLVEAGADAVKVGIGPGSICTTRVVSGVGMPQVTAIHSVSKALEGRGVPIIADGGVRYSGDIAKAIAAGAWVVMIGSLFAGCEESPGEVELYQGRAYKTYRGMGSVAAMAQVHGSSDRYFQDASGGTDKLVPEGIEGRVPFKGSVSKVLHQLIGGLRASMGYTGCADLNALRAYDGLVRVSSAGVMEGHVHDVKITKEAPNYTAEGDYH